MRGHQSKVGAVKTKLPCDKKFIKQIRNFTVSCSLDKIRIDRENRVNKVEV